jgi:FMN phosphatase YigB (HAD superfamily)
MRVSFDLDEVLFVDPKRYKIEKPLRGVWGQIFREKLRKGTIELIHELQKRGFEVWIYTSSYRSVTYLKRLFGLYGIKFDGIINANRHNKEVQGNRKQRLPQKMPSHYQISLHIDDEDNIIRNSKAFGYRAFRVYEPDDLWGEKVLAEAERIRSIEKRQRANVSKHPHTQ